ncbi:MAG TPA: MFS transporter [Spirochaeta sp.]|nr:MFS transporter [Spirochaeta sp.]
MNENCKDLQYYKFSAYGFLKNLRFFEPFFILFLLSRDFSYIQIGTLYAIREVAINIIEIPTGIFADVWGRKKTMLASFISYIIAFIILYRSQSYIILAVAMIFYAFGDACRTGTHKAMIFDYINSKGCGDRKSWYYGNTRAWSQRGSALSALFAGILVFWQGDYSSIFLYSIIPYVLDFILILSYPAYLDKSGDKNPGTKAVLKASLNALKNRFVLKKVVSVSLFSGYYKAVKDYLQPVLQSAALAMPLFIDKTEEQRSAVTIGLVYTVIYFLTSQASSRAGKIHNRFKNAAAILFYTLMIGVGAGVAGGILYYFNMPWLAAAAFLLIFLLQNIRKPIGIGFLGDSIEPQILATVLSVESQSQTLWTAFFAIIIGTAAQLINLPAALVICSAGLFIVGLFTRQN